MGQLGTLLWKNFTYCKRHPIRIALFYGLPLLFASFLFLIVALIDIDNDPDCDYETIALPPSFPVLVTNSLICASSGKCTNDTWSWDNETAKMVRQTKQPPHNIYKEFDPRKLCLGDGHMKSTFKKIGMARYMACDDRRNDTKYTNIGAIDLVFRGKIYYYPQSAEADNLIHRAWTYLDGISEFDNISDTFPMFLWYASPNLTHISSCYVPLETRTKGFASEDEAVKEAQDLNITKDAVWGMIHFLPNTGNNFRYEIVTHYGLRDKISTLYLQSLIEAAVIEERTGQKVQLEQKLLPMRCKKGSEIYQPAFSVMSMVIGMGFIVLAYTMSSEMCAEKAAGLLEFLLIAGVPRWKVKLAWFIFGSVFFVSVAIIIACIFEFISAKLLEYTEFSVFLILAVLFSLSLLCMCFCLASLMSTAQRAGILMFVSLMVGYLLPQWGQLVPDVGYTGGTAILVTVASFLHSVVAAEIGFAYIFAWERLEKGVTWATLADSPDPEDEFGGVQQVMIYLIIQCFMYMFLSWYFDNVAPSKYGVKWPFYFCCMPSYWGGDVDRKKDIDAKGSMGHQVADIEALQTEKEPGICIQTLTKSYGKNKVAVDELSVTFYQNEITALLGHNGAGKSTTMNMLTGMISPTSGSAIIAGYDIWRSMAEVRKTLGFCPQYDIIYPELSVSEHMKFYGELKGIPKDEVEAYSSALFQHMKMTHALKTPAMSLSGGMKRKLSIAIAFLGNPTVIILDEPTSAIDPFSRRAIWDTVLQYRSKATVLISTHYMQEADVLGDRIAIIDKGALKCFGTPMYLKSRYGDGSKLKVAHQEIINEKALQEELQAFVPIALEGSSATESTYGIPIEAARSPKLADAFKFLEKKGGDFGVVSFGISESTMEQVFFNVAEGGGTHDMMQHPDVQYESTGLLGNIDYVNSRGCGLLMVQLWATWVKRFHLSKRSVVGFIFQVLAPLLFMAILLFFNNTIASAGIGGERKLMHPWNSSGQNALFFAGDQKSSFAEILTKEGIGTKCMKETEVPEKKSNDGGENKCLFLKNVELPQKTNDTGDIVECDCSRCPGDAVNPAKNTTVNSNDTLINLFNRNISNYLLKTSEDNIIGGIEEINIVSTLPSVFTGEGEGNGKLSVTNGGKPNPYSSFTSGPGSMTTQSGSMPPRKGFSKTYSFIMYRIWTGIPDFRERRPTKRQLEMRHMKASFLNGYNNVLLKALLQNANGSSNVNGYGITLYTKEVSMNKDLSIVQRVAAILIGFFGNFALMMPTFTVLLIIVTERSSGNKQLQLIMGLNKIMYWLANFIWDMVLYTFSVFLMIGFMSLWPDVFDIDLEIFLMISMLYGCSMILFGYVLSFLMNTARNAIMIIGNISPYFAIAAMILLNWRDEDWYDSVNLLLIFLPPYFITEALIVMEVNKYIPDADPVLSWDVLGKRFAASGTFSIIMLILLICFEAGVFTRLVHNIKASSNAVGSIGEEKDPDVAKEESRILNTPFDENQALTVKQLSKSYGKGKVAVKGVSFGVNRGECFGLLGVNGAGKTTLFKMLTKFHGPSTGDAEILGLSIFKNPAEAARHMSYCPQQDCLFESLTAPEHLHLYGRIRGIPSEQRGEVVEALIHEIGLDPHKTKQSHALSGGNKRKLNFAISIIDYPEVIFLDEMTTGMDPKARRAAWICLEKAVARGCAAVITSHSMEECEALCNRIVIMVNGTFKCIGGIQYLKDKFGNNYNSKFRVGPNGDSEKLKIELMDKFAQATVVEEHLGYVELQMPAEGLRLSTLFEAIHELKSECEIEEFSVSQTTLEHVFVNMVRDQE